MTVFNRTIAMVFDLDLLNSMMNGAKTPFYGTILRCPDKTGRLIGDKNRYLSPGSKAVISNRN
jgi:hypothetical protein